MSSRAFYENFTNVQTCFLAAYDETVALAQRAVRSAQSGFSVPTDPLGRVAHVLDVYLRLLASEPNVAKAFLVEVYAAGPEARQRRLQVHEQFVGAVGAVVSPRRRLNAADARAVEALVDAITFRVTRSLLAGGLGDPPVLVDELVEVTVRLCPWLSRRPTKPESGKDGDQSDRTVHSSCTPSGISR